MAEPSSLERINFDFLLPHIAHVDKIIALPLVVFAFYHWIYAFSIFFYTLNKMITLCLYNTNIFKCLFNHFLYSNHLYSLHV